MDLRDVNSADDVLAFLEDIGNDLASAVAADADAVIGKLRELATAHPHLAAIIQESLAVARAVPSAAAGDDEAGDLCRPRHCPPIGAEVDADAETETQAYVQACVDRLLREPLTAALVHRNLTRAVADDGAWVQAYTSGFADDEKLTFSGADAPAEDFASVLPKVLPIVLDLVNAVESKREASRNVGDRAYAWEAIACAAIRAGKGADNAIAAADAILASRDARFAKPAAAVEAGDGGTAERDA